MLIYFCLAEKTVYRNIADVGDGWPVWSTLTLFDRDNGGVYQRRGSSKTVLDLDINLRTRFYLLGYGIGLALVYQPFL